VSLVGLLLGAHGSFVTMRIVESREGLGLGARQGSGDLFGRCEVGFD
jgi:hypothetical protein